MSLITISVGPRNAYTDKDGLRFYRWRGTDYPSVTTIRRMAGIPFRLHQWAVSQVVERAVEDHDALTGMLNRDRRPRERVLDKNRRKEAKSWLRKASTEKRDESAALGTAVHDAATSHRDPKDVPLEVRPRLRQFYDWVEQSGAVIIAVEQQVFNLGLGYAGTFDLLVRMPNRDVYVVDLKTGNGTYAEHALQLCGYSMADFVGKDDVVDTRLTDLLRSAKGMALLHLQDEGWHWQEVRVTPQLWAAFKGLLTFAVFAHANPDIDGLVSDEDTGASLVPLLETSIEAAQ